MVKIDVAKGTMLRTNNYIISKNERVVLIEASANVEHIKSVIQNKKVEAILLTHGHWDHFLNIEKYIEEFSCKVYMTKEAYVKMQKKDREFYADRKLDVKINLRDIEFIEDKEVLEFDEDLKFYVIKTCGHTDCSVSYLLNDKFLFSGDTLFKDGFGRYDLPTGSLNDLKVSLEKLTSLSPYIVVFPGHGESTTIGDERR